MNHFIERTSFKMYQSLVGIYLKKEDFKAAESLVYKKRMEEAGMNAYRYEVDLGNV